MPEEPHSNALPVPEDTARQRELLLELLGDRWDRGVAGLAEACLDGELLIERLHEPGIWVLIGLPGAGKTTFARAAAAAGRHVVLMEDIRRGGGWKLGEAGFVENAYEIALHRLEENVQPGSLLDSTGLYAPARAGCLEIAARHEVPARAVIVATDPETAWRRTLAKGWERPDVFFRFLGMLCDYLEDSWDEEHWTSRHWLDGSEQERVIAAWAA